MDHLTHGEEARKKRTFAEQLRRVEEEARRKAINRRARFRGLQVSPTASFEDDSGGRDPWDDNWTALGFDLHPHVTLGASAILIALIILALMFKEDAAIIVGHAKSAVTTSMGWFLIFTANIFIVAAFFFAFSKLGNIRIGGKDAEPEFSTPAWYAMLLSAGMGIGLMFWSVGEPMFHLLTPSPMFGDIEPGSAEAAQAAMGVTFFHWGLHPWAIYAIVGLGLAFFAFNRGLPLTIRSVFYPLLGDRIYGVWGNLIDILSVLATIVGLATSLGLGVAQVNAGLSALFGIAINEWVQVLLIAVITGVATISVLTGLDSGVKRLSEANMILAALFMLFVLIFGPTVFILSGLTQNIGFYFEIFPALATWTETFLETNWQGSWTVFYWAWWISWSPFVGMFIARISKGRTVREFVLGVILFPTLLSFIWMSVFGNSALWVQHHGLVDVAAAASSDVATAMFALLEAFPFTAVMSVVAIVLVTVFFITSSDSGSLVVDHLTSGGKLDSPVQQRVFWAVMEGVIASVLLLGGGLATLQTASVTTGLPFAMVLLVSVYSLYIGLSEELYIETAVKRAVDRSKEDKRLEVAINAVVENSDSPNPSP
jgi:choline/glycine/proline betaine transport protein